MPSRRQFLGALAAPPLAVCLDSILAKQTTAALESALRDTRSPDALAGDEDFWSGIAQAFTVDRSLVNLNNGGVSPSPRFVQDAVKRHLDFSNKATAYTMWRVLEPQRESVRKRLALQFGCDSEEIAITRNASEGLQILQFGFDLQRGDVVLTTSLDYPRMLTTFEQRVRREGISLETFDLPVPCNDPSKITTLFVENMEKYQPKLVLMSHVLTSTGAALPVGPIVREARKRGIPVIVDGAHSFAHLDFKRDDIDCDYFATSLHKWLSAPHGSGMLYVRRDKIEGVWPLMAAQEKLDSDIRKFEEIGTHPAANFLAVAEALTFHQAIGGARKLARLVYLREYWMQRLVDAHPDRFVVNTSRAPGMAGAIANVELEGIETRKLIGWLFREHRIVVTGIGGPDFDGVRVSPSVYTTLEELNRFVGAIEWVLDNGLPG